MQEAPSFYRVHTWLIGFVAAKRLINMVGVR